MIGLMKRKGTRRPPELRAYKATYHDGVLTLTGGALVRAIGSDDPTREDRSARLARNIGDTLIVGWAGSWMNVAAVVITAITGGNYNERWTVRVVEGEAPPNGDVTVQAAKRADIKRKARVA